MWASINPGSTVASERSITSAPSGTFTWPAGPTAVIRSPSITTTWPARCVSPVPSKSRPALITSGFGFGFGVAGAEGSAAEGRLRIRPIRTCVSKFGLLPRTGNEAPTLRRADRYGSQS